METKICSKCKTEKSKLNFNKRKASPDKLHHSCKACQKVYNVKYRQSSQGQISKQEWNNNNREKVRFSIRQSMFFAHTGIRITKEHYDNLSATQNNSCAICYINFEELPSKQKHIDHCHTTNKIRGLLCSLCNTSLGGFKDNSDLLDSAKQYLAKEEPSWQVLLQHLERKYEDT